MDILGLVGSPRRGGNTDILVEAVLSSARGCGHVSHTIYLAEHEIGPCIDCRGCKLGRRECVVQDGMQPLYQRLDGADVLVFGTPVYWYGPTGTMKQFVDRLRPYYANGRLRGKRALVAAAAGEGPRDSDLVLEMFRRTAVTLELDLVGHVVGTGYERGDVLNDTPALRHAAALGMQL